MAGRAGLPLWSDPSLGTIWRWPTKASPSWFFDMARTAEPDGECRVDGFATLEAARAYAEARVRASIEELRYRDAGKR